MFLQVLLCLPPSSCLVIYFLSLFREQSSPNLWTNLRNVSLLLRLILLWLKAVFLQGEFYIRRRLFKECGVGLCEEQVFYILGWKMHVHKRCVLRVCLYLKFERANVYIDVLGLWLWLIHLKKKIKTKKEKRERECWELVWVEYVRFVYKHW